VSDVLAGITGTGVPDDGPGVRAVLARLAAAGRAVPTA
jgi:hypothetical protein